MSTDRLSVILQALADPTRRAILARLAEGDATVQELAEPFPISQPAISKHLKVLEEAGLVERRKDAQRRWCRLRAEPLKDVLAYANEFRAYWDESFERLDELLAAEVAANQHDPQPKRTPRTTRPHEPASNSKEKPT